LILFFSSGDLASMDEDGYVRIVGRIKDMINRGGEKSKTKQKTNQKRN